MCIAAFLWKSHPRYPFVLLLNRDEHYNRPTTALAWWENGEILGGKDGLAGGTWLACNRTGKLAFLTNVREKATLPARNSRGDLPVRFLKSEKSPKEFGEELVGQVEEYNGFNLVAADLRAMTIVYITNRPKDNGLSVTEVSPGIHVLSNAKLDTPWPKALRLRRSFEDVIGKCFEGEISVKDMTEGIMKDTNKDDECELPGILSPDYEYAASAIFVEANLPSGPYGTVSTSAVTMKYGGEICFYERSLEKDLWREQTISYRIETEKIASRPIRG
ncbi:uncharacterized protein LOC127260590 [Andrographis paniculata]|uniref:uncharacterized protein LOC127260590 n=1 Tax=Andrographis paniculata TaxID=175694 RepID=UPI0021E973A2|nr:uncharacterized protein LOC127260590 [Andrographis paniculata]